MHRARCVTMSEAEEMTIEEIKEKYKNRWVLVEVVEEDELQRPVKVRFITHSKTRDEIHEALKEHKGYTYHFYTGRIPREAYVVAFSELSCALKYDTRSIKNVTRVTDQGSCLKALGL